MIIARRTPPRIVVTTPARIFLKVKGLSLINYVFIALKY
jgi:hypothetical protein